jgi:hypothetical protein
LPDGSNAIYQIITGSGITTSSNCTVNLTSLFFFSSSSSKKKERNEKNFKLNPFFSSSSFSRTPPAGNSKLYI